MKSKQELYRIAAAELEKERQMNLDACEYTPQERLEQLEKANNAFSAYVERLQRKPKRKA